VSKFWKSFAGHAPQVRLLYVLTFLALITTHAAPGSWNAASRIATVQALVESHTFVIDHTAFIDTGDKVFINGHFYSDKPPLPALMGVAVYWPLYQLGLRLHLGSSIADYCVTLFTVRLFWILGTLAFFHLLEYTGLEAEGRFLAAIALGLGSLYFSWSSTLNSHDLAASFLCIGFLFVLKARFAPRVSLNLAMAGFFLSLAGTTDIPTSIFYAGFSAYVLGNRSLRARSIYYFLPLLITVLPALAITYSIHHSIVPVQLVSSYFQYPGSPWTGSEELSGMRGQISPLYALLLLVGPRGFLLYNPLLIIALYGLARSLAARDRFFAEAVVITVGVAAMLLYYSLFTANFGGWSYSIRWLVPVLPLLFFFLYPYLQVCDIVRARRFRALLVASMIISFVGVIDPWSHRDLSDVPFVANLKEIPYGLHVLRTSRAGGLPGT
jgi:hypothetical protein